MRRRRPAEIFLSFADADRAFAQRLANALRRRRIRIWFAPSRLRGGDQWHDEIGQALARCDWFLLVLSPDAARSFWVKSELKYALSARRYAGRIVPVLFRKCRAERLSWTLPSIQWIAFRGRPFRQALADLLSAWQA